LTLTQKDEFSLKVFEAPEYTTDELKEFFERQIRREGILKKRELEILDGIQIVERPFRRISWKLENPSGFEKKVRSSFIDEELASMINDSDHRFLLWRPRYAILQVKESEDLVDIPFIDNVDAVQEVVDELVLMRWKGQELDDELKPRLRNIQADPLSAIALIVPRTPYGLKREAKLLEERRDIHSFVIASSLIMNCSPKEIVTGVDTGERVFVKTIVAKYCDVSNKMSRILFLETPGASSLRDAQKSGLALKRICDLYPEYKELIEKSFRK